jgi:hypothetical protein
MRPLAVLVVSAAALAGGCSWLKTGEQDRPAPRFTGPIPKKEPAELVAYLNRQAESLRSVSYKDVRATAFVNGKEEGSLNDSSLFAAQPRYVRLLGGHSIAGRILDAGSNEFWMYMKPVDGDNFFYCSHDDYSRGTARLPVPFDPDWVMMALGMTTLDPAAEARAEARDRDGTYVLYHKTTTRQGQPVTKATVFNVETDNGRRPAVKEHLIYDGRTDQPALARAQVKAAKTVTTNDPTGRPTQVQIPTHVVLEWPRQKFSMEMRLSDEVVNESFSDARRRELFTRPTIRGTNPIDLARYEFRPTARGQAPAESRSRWLPAFRR